jgi:hypothetical protein
VVLVIGDGVDDDGDGFGLSWQFRLESGRNLVPTRYSGQKDRIKVPRIERSSEIFKLTSIV